MTAASRIPLPPAPSQLELFSWLTKLQMRDIFNVAEVARMTKLSPQSVYTLIELGELGGFDFKITGNEGQKRITSESLCRYLLKSCTMPDQERSELLVIWAEKLTLRDIDLLLPHLNRRRERLAAQRR